MANKTPMDEEWKNELNAEIAAKIKVGDKVRIKETGRVGIVTKKIEHNRVNPRIYSPRGYTAIQVDDGEHKYTYAGRSLELLN